MKAGAGYLLLELLVALFLGSMVCGIGIASLLFARRVDQRVHSYSERLVVIEALLNRVAYDIRRAVMSRAVWSISERMCRWQLVSGETCSWTLDRARLVRRVGAVVQVVGEALHVWRMALVVRTSARGDEVVMGVKVTAHIRAVQRSRTILLPAWGGCG